MPGPRRRPPRSPPLAECLRPGCLPRGCPFLCLPLPRRHPRPSLASDRDARRLLLLEPAGHSHRFLTLGPCLAVMSILAGVRSDPRAAVSLATEGLFSVVTGAARSERAPLGTPFCQHHRGKREGRGHPWPSLPRAGSTHRPRFFCHIDPAVLRELAWLLEHRSGQRRVFVDPKRTAGCANWRPSSTVAAPPPSGGGAGTWGFETVAMTRSTIQPVRHEPVHTPAV